MMASQQSLRIDDHKSALDQSQRSRAKHLSISHSPIAKQQSQTSPLAIDSTKSSIELPPPLKSGDLSYGAMGDISFLRCSSAELQLVLDDVECEYADSMSTMELHPFGQEMPSTEAGTSFLDGVIDDHQREMDIANAPTPKTATISSPAAECLSFVAEENKVDDISSIFDRRGVLGSGASCRVLRATHSRKRTDYALKEMSRGDPSNLKKFEREVEVLKMLDHPDIIDFEDCYVDENSLYIATEYCSGGTLLDKLNRMQTLSEVKSAGYIRTLLEVVHHMHSLNVVHQDLKLINLVFTKPGMSGKLKVIDVGDSVVVDDDTKYYKFSGTRFYMPPEISRPRTGREMKKGDIWTVGIIAYLLVFGRRPFLMSGNPNRRWKDVLNSITSRTRKAVLSDECRDFLAKCLELDPAQRMSAEELLEHDWITGMSAEMRKKEKRLVAMMPSTGTRRRYFENIQHRAQSAQSMDFDVLDEFGVDSLLDTIGDDAQSHDLSITVEPSPEITDCSFYGGSTKTNTTTLGLTFSDGATLDIQLID